MDDQRLVCSYRANGSPCSMRARRRNLCKPHFELQYLAPLRKELINSKEIVFRLQNQIKELENELDYTYDAEVIMPAPQRRDMYVCAKCKKRYDSVPETMQHERFCRGPKPARVKRESVGPRLHAERVESLIIEDDLGEQNI